MRAPGRQGGQLGRPVRAPGLQGGQFQGGGFTLIELLVVISIIGVLAAFLLSVGGGVARKKYIGTSQSEMASIATALEAYKAQYGFYPPSNPNTTPINYRVNPLYFELEGVTVNTTNNPANPTYTTLDGMQTVTSNELSSLFGVSGVINCTHGSGEDMISAKNFLSDLKANQVGTNNNVAILITSVGGPDASYMPLGGINFNPWRYNSVNPSNNPTAYDLYVQLQIGGKKYLVCNWSKQTPINNPLP